jgi:hypothetical protein
MPREPVGAPVGHPWVGHTLKTHPRVGLKQSTSQPLMKSTAINMVDFQIMATLYNYSLFRYLLNILTQAIQLLMFLSGQPSRLPQRKLISASETPLLCTPQFDHLPVPTTSLGREYYRPIYSFRSADCLMSRPTTPELRSVEAIRNTQAVRNMSWHQPRLLKPRR